MIRKKNCIFFSLISIECEKKTKRGISIDDLFYFINKIKNCRILNK